MSFRRRDPLLLDLLGQRRGRIGDPLVLVLVLAAAAGGRQLLERFRAHVPAGLATRRVDATLGTVEHVTLLVSLGLVVLIALLLVARRWATRRLLARKRSYTVYPANTFDPDRPAIEAYARMIAGVVPNVGAWLTWRARAVDHELRSAPGGAMVYGLRIVPGPTLRAATSAYTGLMIQADDGEEAEG